MPAVIDGSLEEKGYQQIIGLAAAVGLTPPEAGAHIAHIQCLTQNVRWHPDGTPTATLGTQLAVGDVLVYNGNLDRIKFIEELASAELNITYFTNP